MTSVRLETGIVWGSLVIETMGGPDADIEIRGLERLEARTMAAIIKEHVLPRNAGAARPAQE